MAHFERHLAGLEGLNWGEPTFDVVLDLGPGSNAEVRSDALAHAATLHATGSVVEGRLVGLVDIGGGHLNAERSELVAAFLDALKNVASEGVTPAVYCHALMQSAVEAQNFDLFAGARIEVILCVRINAKTIWLWRVGVNSVWLVQGTTVRRLGECQSRSALIKQGIIKPYAVDLPNMEILEATSSVFALETPDGWVSQVLDVSHIDGVLLFGRGMTPTNDELTDASLLELWHQDAGWRHGLAVQSLGVVRDASGVDVGWPGSVGRRGGEAT